MKIWIYVQGESHENSQYKEEGEPTATIQFHPDAHNW